MTFRTRFAPSPSGYLHLGHAFSAWTAWQAARAAGGEFLLRMEDIDTVRCKPEFDAAILDDLDWLGLDWTGDVRRQSEHFSAYEDVLTRLRNMELVYRCFKTRKEVLADIARAPHAAGEVYRGPATSMPADEETERVARGESFAWRLSIDHCRDQLGSRFDQLDFEDQDGGRLPARADAHGDVILARKDLGTSYHIAVVHDDALQAISHVIRGEDLLEMTGLHVLLQTLLGYPTPVYRHHRLLTDESGKRFAKRDRAATLRSMRESGATPEDVIARFA